jgi:hypothetical protein
MKRRRRDSRPADRGHGTARDRAEFRETERFVALLRRFQLASAVVMLVGVATATLVCAGEFQQPWLVAAGGGVFVLGLALFAASRPFARRWMRS